MAVHELCGTSGGASGDVATIVDGHMHENMWSVMGGGNQHHPMTSCAFACQCPQMLLSLLLAGVDVGCTGILLAKRDLNYGKAVCTAGLLTWPCQAAWCISGCCHNAKHIAATHSPADKLARDLLQDTAHVLLCVC